jgi:3-oxoacyl-(acyl-carrier-protein) synthase
MAPTRGGFMEAQGAGMQLLCTARLALAMGLPIYGVVALSSTATDKNGRSIPAPGQGVLRVTQMQKPGGKRLAFAELLRGQGDWQAAVLGH